MRELLIGCGNNKHQKKITLPEMEKEFQNLTTLDWDDSADPDVVHNLNDLPYPFMDDEFDEIHAYEVLEHCGTQGDWRFFFDQFEEFHRILKPDGILLASVPMWDSPWAWGDPGHTRIITAGSLIFLSQAEYEKQVGKTPMTDYRSHYSADFEVVAGQELDDSFGFILRAIK